ncbi:hypothetical protein ACXIU3_07200 [Vibrio parahaemolyticus]
MKGMIRTLFNNKVQSVESVEKLLKVVFVIQQLPLLLLILVWFFMRDTFASQYGSHEMQIYSLVYCALMSLLGVLIFRRKAWAAYMAMGLIIVPTLFIAYLESSFPRFGLYDVWAAIFLAASYRCIKYLRN